MSTHPRIRLVVHWFYEGEVGAALPRPQRMAQASGRGLTCVNDEHAHSFELLLLSDPRICQELGDRLSSMYWPNALILGIISWQMSACLDPVASLTMW